MPGSLCATRMIESNSAKRESVIGHGFVHRVVGFLDDALLLIAGGRAQFFLVGPPDIGHLL